MCLCRLTIIFANLLLFNFCGTVYSMKEYEERAVSLALNRPKLQALTSKLKAVRMTCPLFDTTRWVSGDYIETIQSIWCFHCLYSSLS